tara:strand:- start:4464 stop:5078 length:615 start_codon:yes stop_codon:yes gene_type:complete
MKRLLLLSLAFLLISTGCIQFKAAYTKAFESPIGVNAKSFVDGVKEKDWPKVYDSALRLQVQYAVLVGSQTVEEEYGTPCAQALAAYFDDPDMGSVVILRDSPLIGWVEMAGPLNNITGITIGRVIHAGAIDTGLKIPHEIAHVQQYAQVGDTFPVQYLSTLLTLGSRGYYESFFEQLARGHDAAFIAEYGGICESPKLNPALA